MSTNNVHVKIPPMLPTAPLPLNVVASSNVMYMYSCSQCEFKTHIESLFKQHVDSVHLGIPNVPSNAVLGQTTGSPAGTVQVTTTLPSAASVLSVTQPQTIVVGGQLLTTATGLPTVVTTSAMANLSAVASQDKLLHKCPKCNLLLPSKNQLTQHKRKVHGKTVLAAATGGALTAPAVVSNSVTYAVVQPPSPTSAPSVASLLSQPVSVLAAVASAASAVTAGSTGSPTANPVVATSNVTGKKTYSCTACGYSTTRRDGLSQHYDSVHLKIKNHQCELCPYAASQKGTLNRHVKLRHKKKLLLPVGTGTTIGNPAGMVVITGNPGTAAGTTSASPEQVLT